jgi:hypothetical protein
MSESVLIYAVPYIASGDRGSICSSTAHSGTLFERTISTLAHSVGLKSPAL